MCKRGQADEILQNIQLVYTRYYESHICICQILGISFFEQEPISVDGNEKPRRQW